MAEAGRTELEDRDELEREELENESLKTELWKQDTKPGAGRR